MIKIGIIGLPNAGKTTLFNAFSGQSALVASYPFSTISTNRAIINIPDEHFTRLGKRIEAKGYKYSKIELWDIAGLIHGASMGNGLGNEFLGQIKDCDLLLHVVRDNDKDMRADERTVLAEIALFDASLMQKPFEKNRHLVHQYPNDTKQIFRDKTISKIYESARKGMLLDRQNVSLEEIALLEEFGIIGIKPRLRVINSHNTSMPISIGIGGEFIFNASEYYEVSRLSDKELNEIGISYHNLSTLISNFFKCILDMVSYKTFLPLVILE